MSEKKLKIILPIIIMALGLLITVVLIKSRGPVPTRPQHEYTPLVRVIEVQPSDYQLTVPAHGTVKPRTEAKLVCEVAGRIIDVASSFADGGLFKRGDVLVRIDPRDYELAVVTARGVIAQARVTAELEEAEAEVARKEWNELGEGKASPLATRELQLEQARAALASAEASLERAERNLARTHITAPYNGRIRSKLVDIGQYVSPGTPVADVFAVDYVEVPLPIHDAELAYLDMPVTYNGYPHTEDDPMVILSAEFAGRQCSWSGRIVRVEGEIDPVSRMVNVVAQVDDPYGSAGVEAGAALAVGLFVDAEIFGREVEGAVVLPRSAIRGENKVLVVDDESRLRFREVEILRVSRTEAVITGGLSAGERVCVSLLEAVTDGMRVRTSGASERVDSSAVQTGSISHAEQGGARPDIPSNSEGSKAQTGGDESGDISDQ